MDSIPHDSKEGFPDEAYSQEMGPAAGLPCRKPGRKGKSPVPADSLPEPA